MLITSDKYTIGGTLRIPHIALAVILNPLVKSMGSRFWPYGAFWAWSTIGYETPMALSSALARKPRIGA